MRSSALLTSLLSASAALALPRHEAISRATTDGDVSQVALPYSLLPTPAANLKLKYVALGIGTQNYTCKATPNDAGAAPAGNGARATLYDAVPVLSKGTPSIRNSTEQILPPLALSLATAYKTAVPPDHWPAPVTLRAIGSHFFAPPLLPTFVLSGASPPARIQVAKLANTPAPADACKGVDGEGAVDWLELGDNGSGYGSGTPLGGGAVYRVETAGGAAPKTCAGYTGDILVQYAAEYFFYGPA